MNNDLNKYDDKTHLWGRLWMITATLLIVAVPAAICLYFNAWPPINGVLKGLLGVVPIYWTVCTIEVFTYAPMLGSGGTYLGFVTGNLTNLKVPCAINAMESAKVKPGTPEGEVLSTIAIAVSSIVTTIIIAVGVILFVQLTPLLESSTLKPAFDNILPALFGGLGVVYIAKSWKVAILPLAVMVVLFVVKPSLASSVGILVPIGAIISISWARFLYKKNML